MRYDLYINIYYIVLNYYKLYIIAYETEKSIGVSDDRLGEGNDFDKKINSPFEQVKLFLPAWGKNPVTVIGHFDTDNTVTNNY